LVTLKTVRILDSNQIIVNSINKFLSKNITTSRQICAALFAFITKSRQNKQTKIVFSGAEKPPEGFYSFAFVDQQQLKPTTTLLEKKLKLKFKLIHHNINIIYGFEFVFRVFAKIFLFVPSFFAASTDKHCARLNPCLLAGFAVLSKRELFGKGFCAHTHYSRAVNKVFLA
jgi:hypothetical protein